VLLLTEFDYIVKYKPGSLHKQADHLFRLSIELGTGEINDDFLNASMFSIGVVPTWYEHISEFLNTQQLHEGLSKNERCKFKLIVPILLSFWANFIARGLLASCRYASHMGRFQLF
jgi:hypothetical protein